MIVFLNFNYKINITPEELSCQNEHSRLQTSSGGDTVLISSVEPLTQLGSCVALCSFDTLSARGREGRKEVDSQLHHHLLLNLNEVVLIVNY